MNQDMMEALQAVATERGLTIETLFAALADALESAYKRRPDAWEYSWVTIDPDTMEFRVFAQELDEYGDPFGEEFEVTPDDFGRIAAQTTRQVMSQRIREAERELKYEEYAGREGDIVTGIIQQTDSRYTLLDLGRVEALLPQAEQVPHERPDPNTRLKAYIVEVRKTPKGPQIVVSRTHPGLIKRMFELEVPEIADGIVEIMACAREPGHRTKIAVRSNDENVDPVGACVGARGSRVRMIVNEMKGEKIDIVEVRKTPKGPQIVVSRTHPGLIKRMFELEVPEIADGIVEIMACAREPGHRTKIAVRSNDENVDPVGACVGARGSRVRMIVNEMKGEKIDIVPFSENTQDFVMKALSPAKVKEVLLDETTGTATVVVPDYQLSLAIGKEGQNARLAARLTGWRVDIKSETEMAEEKAYSEIDWAAGEWITDDETGEQMWQPAAGGDAISSIEWELMVAANNADADTAATDSGTSSSDEEE